MRICEVTRLRGLALTVVNFSFNYIDLRCRILTFDTSCFTLYDQLEMSSGRIASGPPGVAAFRDLPEQHEWCVGCRMGTPQPRVTAFLKALTHELPQPMSSGQQGPGPAAPWLGGAS